MKRYSKFQILYFLRQKVWLSKKKCNYRSKFNKEQSSDSTKNNPARYLTWIYSEIQYMKVYL